jgi:exopolyphosphatase/guanosine-5'-triphosphate,3'-diphosphate pyrophosphatase
MVQTRITATCGQVSDAPRNDVRAPLPRPSALGDGRRVAIVPRWEWRTFGDGFGDAERRLAELEPDRVQASDDLYLVAAGSDASVKIRDGLLDVKLRRRVDDHGLEQWEPVAKLELPVSGAGVALALQALGTDPPARLHAAYTAEQLLGEVVRPRADLRALPVRKRHTHFLLGGCMAELSELETDLGATRTLGVESEDPDLVVAVVRELGLWGRPNVSLPRRLKAFAGLGARRFAVIDVGTNSVKLHVAERRADGEWRVLADRAEITRLGEGLADAGRLGDEPMTRTGAAIAAMADEAGGHGVHAIAAVGTAALRTAPNRAALLDAVREHAGVEVEVISGAEEARLAYVAATSGLALGDGSLVVFDTGGGSSQFTRGRPGEIADRFSVDVGATRITERFGLAGAVGEDTIAAALDAIAADLGRLDDWRAPDLVLGLGGAITNLAAVKLGLTAYDADAVHGTVLDRAEVERQIERYRTLDAGARRGIAGLQPARAEVILAGACIVRAVLGKLRAGSLTVSDRGLRHGVLAERFGSDTDDGREQQWRATASPARAW